MLDLKDLADEQRWTYRPKGDGLIFHPPPEKRRPGMDTVYVFDPGNDTHSKKVLTARLRRAGMKFHDDQEPEMNTSKAAPITQLPLPKTSTAGGSPPRGPEAFALLTVKINEAISLLSEIEQIVSTIRTETGKAQALRDQLKELIGG